MDLSWMKSPWMLQHMKPVPLVMEGRSRKIVMNVQLDDNIYRADRAGNLAVSQALKQYMEK